MWSYVIGFGETLSASLEIFSIIIFISLRCFSCFVDTCHAPWTAHSYRGVPHQTLPHKCQPLSVRWEASRFPKRKHVVVFTFPCVFSILSLNWRKAYHSVTRMKVINCIVFQDPRICWGEHKKSIEKPWKDEKKYSARVGYYGYYSLQRLCSTASTWEAISAAPRFGVAVWACDGTVASSLSTWVSCRSKESVKSEGGESEILNVSSFLMASEKSSDCVLMYPLKNFHGIFWRIL